MNIKLSLKFGLLRSNKKFKDSNIIFIRHAQSTFNQACIEGAQLLQIDHLHWDHQMKNRQFAESVAFNAKYIDCPITPQGILNSQKTGQIIKNKAIDVVLVSPKLRALQTCNHIFKKRNVPILVEPLLAQSCRFSCDAIRKGTLRQKIDKFTSFDFSKVKQQRVAYNILPSMIQQYDLIVNQQGLKSQEEKQRLLAEMISKKQIYENDEQLRKRAWEIKQLLVQYSQKYSNICVVSHWYTLAAVLSKGFSSSSQNLDYVDTKNCRPYFYKLSELLQVK